MDEEELAQEGKASYEWARAHMPVLSLALKHIKRNTHSSSSFEGLRLSACLHISKETSVLINSLHSLGMEIRLVAANPLSSQEDIVSFLSNQGIEVRAHRGESTSIYEAEIQDAAKWGPDLILDDGGELHVTYSKTRSDSCFGGTDETTSGTLRLRALAVNKRLRYPTIPVNEANSKHLFDNRYGTGQSAIDGLMRATGLLVAGKTVVVAGYGWVGRGVAERARGFGARVAVTEVDPIKALEARLDGFQVLRMNEATRLGDIFLTCTGQISVINSNHFPLLKEGAILANVGHFNEEIDTHALYRMGERVERVRNGIVKIFLRSANKSVYLLNQGRVVNLVSAEGHPPEIMQLSFANQILSLHYLLSHRKELKHIRNKVLAFPREIDELVAKFALRGFDLKIDRLSSKQSEYSQSFKRGFA